MSLFTPCPRMSRPKTEVGYYANNLGAKVLMPFLPESVKEYLRDEPKQTCESLTYYMQNYFTKCIIVTISMLSPISLLSKHIK